MMRIPSLKRARALPAAIAVMAALLLVKGMILVRSQDGAPAMLSLAGRAMIPPAQASAHPAEPVKPRTPPVSPAPPAPTPRDDGIPDSERAILLELRGRRQAIDTKEQALTARESILAAAERRIGERVEQLTALQTRLEQLEAGRREREDANWRGLTRTYETMRPRDAASILSEMDNAVLLQVLDRMKEAKAALVLAAMPPDRARAATMLLAQMRSSTVAPPVLTEPGPAGRR